MISGAVAGLGAITPASGFVLPWHGVIIGLAAGAVCYWSCTRLKFIFGYDDSLDVFGVHGVGGVTGTLLAGVFATRAIGDVSGLLEGHPNQVLIQLYGIGVTLAWSAVGDLCPAQTDLVLVPLRVDKQSEIEGLDVAQHGESLQ